MLDFIILTDVSITKNSCEELLKNYFRTLLLLNDSPDYLYMKKGRRGFEIYFTPNDVLDDPDSMMLDTVERCPNKKAYLTNISTTSLAVAQQIVKLLISFYGNMWIQSDEEDDWFGTAEEFLQKSTL